MIKKNSHNLEKKRITSRTELTSFATSKCTLATNNKMLTAAEFSSPDSRSKWPHSIPIQRLDPNWARIFLLSKWTHVTSNERFPSRTELTHFAIGIVLCDFKRKVYKPDTKVYEQNRAQLFCDKMNFRDYITKYSREFKTKNY